MMFPRVSLLAAALAASLSHARAAADPALYEAAKKEGELVWYTTLILDTAVRPLISAFTKKYPGVNVKFSRADSVPQALKIVSEGRAGKMQADVFDGTETSAPIIEAGFAANYVPTESHKYPEGVKDKDGLWHAFMLYYLTPAVNTDLVKPADIPKSLDDLLDQIGRAHV